MEQRLARWMHRETWQLWEACDLVFHVLPIRGLRQLWLARVLDSELLCDDWVKRAAISGTLPVLRRDGASREWWVHPPDFCRWVATQSQVIGADRAALFAQLVPRELPAVSPSVRREVIESGYSTPEFDAALEAIAKFWLAPKEDRNRSDSKMVMDWLMTEKKLTKSAAERVDTLIRHPDAKAGGRKPTPQKSK